MERNTSIKTAVELRHRAESKLKHACGSSPAKHTWAAERLRHELQVHEVELEVQNEELRAAQLELQESRDRYKELYEVAPVAHLTLDPWGKILEANLTASQLLGVGRAKLGRRPLGSFMRQRDSDRLFQHLQQVFDSNKKTGCDLLLESQAHRGRPIPVRMESVAFRDAEGVRVACRSVLVDLSELHDVQDGLRAAEARSTTLLDTAVDAIISSDANGDIESFNGAAQRLFGYDESEVLGKNVRMLTPTDCLEAHEDGTRKRLTGGRSRLVARLSREVTGVKKDGTSFPLELAIGEWCDNGRKKFTTIIRDISERQAADRGLRESEARFRLIAGCIDDALLVHDRAGRRTTYASPAFEKIWGRPVSELYSAGSVWPDWTHPLDRKRIGEAYSQQLKGDPFDEEYRICRPDGEIRWVRVRTYPVENGDAPVSSDVAVVQDITSERELEEELRQAQKMEAVGALASGVAHDFNNVLQGLLGCINVARSKNTSPERARAFLDRAADAARHGGELAAKLNAFARKEKANPKPLKLDATVQGVASLIQRLVTEQVSVDLKMGAGTRTILADAVQLEQILLNLAANARDAMPEGGTLSIRTSTIQADDPANKRHSLNCPEGYVRMSVEDTGIGMNEETRRRVFEPFFTTKELNRGTGLGLSTVFQVTRQLRGFVEVSSQLGAGTRFDFLFPCCHSVEEVPSSRRRARLRLGGTALLVEDEPLVRMTVRHYLQELGLVVLDAEGPKQALEICETRRTGIDLLLSDMVLPSMSGQKLAGLLKRRYPNLRILLMSANPEFLEAEPASLIEASVLRKPFGQQQLAETLRELLVGAEQQPHEPRTKCHIAPSPGCPTQSLSDKTVLLVEDEATSRRALAQVLRDSGYSVLEAAGPAEAFQAAAAHGQPIDLILTDIHLPDMSGEVLASQLRRSHPLANLIYMSGLPVAPEGDSPFVQKPIDLDTLLAIVDRTLKPGRPQTRAPSRP